MLAAIGALGALCSAAQANDAAPAAPLPVARPADVGSTPAVARAGGAVEASGASATQSAGASTDGQAARQRIRALLRREAGFSGLPYDIADAVTAIESGYDPGVIGAVGEIGLMQVRPETAAMLGFQGDAAELARPEINVHYGVAYLAGAWRLAKGDVCRALMKYRAGHNQELMTPLSATCRRAAFSEVVSFKR